MSVFFLAPFFFLFRRGEFDGLIVFAEEILRPIVSKKGRRPPARGPAINDYDSGLDCWLMIISGFTRFALLFALVYFVLDSNFSALECHQGFTMKKKDT